MSILPRRIQRNCTLCLHIRIANPAPIFINPVIDVKIVKPDKRSNHLLNKERLIIPPNFNSQSVTPKVYQDKIPSEQILLPSIMLWLSPLYLNEGDDTLHIIHRYFPYSIAKDDCLGKYEAILDIWFKDQILNTIKDQFYVEGMTIEKDEERILISNLSLEPLPFFIINSEYQQFKKKYYEIQGRRELFLEMDFSESNYLIYGNNQTIHINNLSEQTII